MDKRKTLTHLPALPVNAEESQYLDIVRDIIEHGVHRGDRTGAGTLSKFGVQIRFSLRNHNFPLITTKKVFWRGLAEELLWFIKGSTNANELRERKAFISGMGMHLDSSWMAWVCIIEKKAISGLCMASR